MGPVSAAGASGRLIEPLDPRPGQTILDLAAGLGGTGSLAACRVGETGRALVTDFAPSMVAAARRLERARCRARASSCGSDERIDYYSANRQS
jgi:ubiquinone/menaquinone biosynthesis C-methylase UbiE